MTNVHTLTHTLQSQIDAVIADPKRIFQGRTVAYLAGKLIYLGGARIRYNLAMGRNTPIDFFEPVVAADRLRAVAVRKSNKVARTSVKVKKAPPTTPWAP